MIIDIVFDDLISTYWALQLLSSYYPNECFFSYSDIIFIYIIITNHHCYSYIILINIIIFIILIS